MHATPGERARRRLLGHITSCWRTKALHVAVQLQLPDLLAAGPREAASLAATCGCEADGVLRLLRAMCTLDVCVERPDGRFELTATGSLLRTDAPGERPGLRPVAMWWGGPMWGLWDELGYSVRSGRSARERQTGKAQYTFLDGEPELASLFHQVMQAQTGLVASEVAALGLWRDTTSVVDVGGGNGALAAAVVAAHPHLRAVVFDRADAERGAQTLFRAWHVADRVRFVAGDFFEAVPSQGDAYLLKSILHNWGDAACRTILQRCADAARPGARLLLVERVLPNRLKATARHEALARTDLNMLAGLGGRERALPEFVALLRGAGFRFRRSRALGHEFSVVEAQRV